MDFYSARSLKQQSADRHVAPLGHIILILSQPFFALSPLCCMLGGEATNTNLIVFGLIWSGLDPTIYRTWGDCAKPVHRFTQKHTETPQNTQKHIINKTTIWNQRTDEKNMHLWIFVLVLETRKVNWRVISRTITPSFSHIYIF